MNFIEYIFDIPEDEEYNMTSKKNVGADI